MANRRKGEVELVAGDDLYHLRFSTNAICSLEEELDIGINELGEKLSDPRQFRISTFRSIVRSCLTTPVTIEQAGEIIDKVGIAEVGKAVGLAFQVAFPDAAAGEQGNGKAATGGTGTSS